MGPEVEVADAAVPAEVSDETAKDEVDITFEAVLAPVVAVGVAAPFARTTKPGLGI